MAERLFGGRRKLPSPPEDFQIALGLAAPYMHPMIRAFNNAKVIVFAIFLILTAVAWAYEFLYAIPKQKCEQGGGWWASRWHACGLPIDLQKMPRMVEQAPSKTPPKTTAIAKPAVH